MIYLDNAATSFPKPKCVIREVSRCISEYCGNPGRSSHRLSIAAADKIYETREKIAEFLCYAKSENVIFTPNATYALNLAIKGLLTKKCHCIISDLEHNSILRPLCKAQEKYGVDYSVFDTDKSPDIAIPPLIREDTELIICTLCSNVTGKILDFISISNIARKYNLKLILDASQYAGHNKLDLSNLYFTALCSAGHKGLFGIQGSAFIIINDCILDTITEGGSGIDSFSSHMPIYSPERYEAGTLSTPAIASLNAGIEYISQIGIDNIENHILKLTDELKNTLDLIPSIEVYGINNGIASFNIRDLPSSKVSYLLDEKGIATRSGFHCSPIIHTKLGTSTSGAVRVSLSYLNSNKDINKLFVALKNI